MSPHLTLSLALFALGTLAPGPGVLPVSASNWPSWRGPSAHGSIATGQPPTRWSPETPLWKVPLPGKGGSSPVVWNDRIYLTTPADKNDAVLALDAAGNRLWLTALGAASPPKHQTLASSCNASPVTDGQALFVYFRSGHFAALDLDGKVRWQQNLHDRFGPEKLFWDQGTSPVLTDRHVVLARMHGGDSWLAGFDKGTGELRWKVARNHQVPNENNNGYSTPVLFEHQGRQALLVWGADRLTAHDAGHGELLWTATGFNPDGTAFWPAIASPVVLRDLAIVPVGRDDRPGQSRVHAIRLGGSGDLPESRRAWKREDLGVFVSSPAAYQDRLYLLRHRGDIACLDPASGNTLWTGSFPRTSSSFYASPVIANGVLYAAREDGTVFVARVGERFELLAEIPMGERIISTPVPTGDRLLLRTDKHLFCVGAKDGGAGQ